MAELKKCPFCGGDCLYKTFEVNDLGDEIPVIFCNWCKVVFKVENDSPFLNCKDTYEYLEEKNIKAWNNRPTEAEIREKAISDFLQFVYDNASNEEYANEDGWAMSDLIDLEYKFVKQLKEEQ